MIPRRHSWLFASAVMTLACPGTGAAPVPSARVGGVDVVFCVDTTASMGDGIQAVQATFASMRQAAGETWPRVGLRVAVVAYRDRGDEYLTRVCQFTENLDTVALFLRDLRAAGGGDVPEAVHEALHVAVEQLDWGAVQPARRVVWLVGDAPPHPAEERGLDLRAMLHKARQQRIAIHAVQLGEDPDCADHWRTLAQQTNGSYHPLGHEPQQLPRLVCSVLGLGANSRNNARSQ